MIWLSLKNKDFSRLPLPLTHRDLIWLSVFGNKYDDLERRKRLVLEDIQWLLLQSSIVNLDDAAIKYMPSQKQALADGIAEVINSRV